MCNSIGLVVPAKVGTQGLQAVELAPGPPRGGDGSEAARV
jgi:hypothetical protein